MSTCVDRPLPALSAIGRGSGSYNDAGDVFICAGCQADAKQFIEIQNSIRIQAGEANDADDATTANEHPDAS